MKRVIPGNVIEGNRGRNNCLRVYTRKQVNTYTYTRKQVNTYTYTQTSKHIQIYTQTSKHIHIYTHTHPHHSSLHPTTHIDKSYKPTDIGLSMSRKTPLYVPAPGTETKKLQDATLRQLARMYQSCRVYSTQMWVKILQTHHSAGCSKTEDIFALKVARHNYTVQRIPFYEHHTAQNPHEHVGGGTFHGRVGTFHGRVGTLHTIYEGVECNT